jgi:TolB-like protein/tetratricopeptide (TPR) repeat protein
MRLLGVGGALAVVALGGALLVRRPPAVSAPVLVADRIAVAPFENLTRDSALAPLGTVAADWLTHALLQPGTMQVVPVTASLASVRAPTTDTVAAGDPVLRLALQTGAALIVSGVIEGQGDSLRLRATLTDARDRHVVANVAPVVVQRERAVDGIDTLRQRIIAALAPQRDAHPSDSIVAPGPPPRYAAYREYALGLERFVASDWAGAVARFDRASAADTGYVAPWLMAAAAHSRLGDRRAVAVALRRTAPRRGELSALDAASYDALEATLRGDHAGAYQAARRAAQLAPGTIAHAMVATEALALNRPREAARVLDSLDPTRGELRGYLPYWVDLTSAHHLLGDYTDELYAARRARALHPGSAEAFRLELRAMAALGRCGRISGRLEADSVALPSADLRNVAHECAAHGDSKAAQRLADRALAAARTAAEHDPRSATALDVVEALATAGRLADAKSLADSLLFMETYDVNLRGRRGVIAVRTGDSAAARDADEWLSRPRPVPDYGRSSLWRARLAATRSDTTAAIAFLDRAVQEGMAFGPSMHADPDLASLRASPAFRSRLSPKD